MKSICGTKESRQQQKAVNSLCVEFKAQSKRATLNRHPSQPQHNLQLPGQRKGHSATSTASEARWACNKQNSKGPPPHVIGTTMGRVQQSHPKDTPNMLSASRVMGVEGLRLSGSYQRGIHVNPRSIKGIRPKEEALQGLRHAIHSPRGTF